MSTSGGAGIQTGRLKQTVFGTNFASSCLERTQQSATFAFLFPEASTVSGLRLLKLKVGKYLFGEDGRVDIKTLESILPKSEVHLSSATLEKLIRFLESNVRPMKEDKRVYVALSDESEATWLKEFKRHFGKKSVPQILDLIDEHKLLADDVRKAVMVRDKERAISEFAAGLDGDANEHFWQKWFERNDWVLGSDFVAVLDERRIDPEHQGDYLVKAIDGFLEVIEIKRPGLEFWEGSKDHGNYVPHPDLTRAITQGFNYLFELEREMNSIKAKERFQGVPIAKPRAVLIHGRSSDWNEEQFLAQRLLNGGLSGLQVFTYDQVLLRAKRVLQPTALPEKPASDEDPF